MNDFCDDINKYTKSVDSYIKYIDEDILSQLAEATKNEDKISKRLKEKQDKIDLLNHEITALRNELSSLKEENSRL